VAVTGVQVTAEAVGNLVDRPVTELVAPVGCQKSVVAVTSRYRLTKDYDAPSLIILTGGGLVWSGRSSTSHCAVS
jgi:hypothetical protein